MKKILSVIMALVLTAAMSAQTPDVKLTEVQQLKLDNLHLQKITLMQSQQMLQQQFSTTTQQLQALEGQAKELGDTIIKEQKVEGFTFDTNTFQFVKTTPAPKPPITPVKK